MLEGLRHHLGHHSGAQLGDRGWSLFKAQSPPLRPQGRPCNLHVLTIVGIRLDGAEAQVPTEEGHGWVLALGTLAGHVAVRGKLGAKRVEWLPTPPSRWARMDSICTQPLPWAVPILSRVEDTLFRAPILSLGIVLSTFNTFPYYLISQRAPRSWCLCASTVQEKAEAQRGSGTAGPLTPLQGLSTSVSLLVLGPRSPLSVRLGLWLGVRVLRGLELRTSPRPPCGWTGIRVGTED